MRPARALSTKTKLLCAFSVIAGLIVSDVSGDTPESTQRALNPDQWLTVTEIVQRNLEAVRGVGAPTGVQSTDKTLSISEADNSLTGRYRAESGGHMRIDVFADGKRVYSEGKDDSGVWEWPGGKPGPENVYHDGVGALEHGLEFNLFPLAELSQRGHEIELLDRELIRRNWYYVLKITLTDGFETFRFVNDETWLVDISRDFRAFHPTADATKKNIETRYDQWQLTNGILHATRSRNYDLDANQLIATTLVTESKYNVPLAELDLERSYTPTGSGSHLISE